MIYNILSAVGFGFGIGLAVFGFAIFYLLFVKNVFENMTIMAVFSFVLISVGLSMTYLGLPI
jgi:hypothetical protein